MVTEVKAAKIRVLSEQDQQKRAFANVIIDNILYLAGRKNISNSELEKEAGISAGYLSRLMRPDNTTVPNVEVLQAFAKKLGVTVDYLINPRTNDTTENESLLIRFFNKLTEDTEASDLEWYAEMPDELDMMNGMDLETGEPEHPLFRAVEKPKPWGSDYPEWETRYLSYFGDQAQSKFKGDCFHTEIARGTELYIMNIETYEIVELKDGSSYDNEIDCLEVCLYKDGVEPLCRTDLVSDELNDAVRRLYYTIRRERDSNKMSKKAKSIIEVYVGDALPF